MVFFVFVFLLFFFFVFVLFCFGGFLWGGGGGGGGTVFFLPCRLSFSPFLCLRQYHGQIWVCRVLDHPKEENSVLKNNNKGKAEYHICFYCNMGVVFTFPSADHNP